MLFGRLPLGSCERLDGERVVTQFAVLGPLLVPFDTVYALGSLRTARVFPVRRSVKSIALAYLRWVASPLVLLVAFIASSGDAPGPPQLDGTAKLLLAGMFAAWVGVVFLTGRTWGREARQRRVLAACVGHGAPPEQLFPGTQALGLEELERAWGERAIGGESWRDLYPKDPSERSLPLYYALCRYEAALSEEPVMTNRANRAWTRLEESLPKVETWLAERRARPRGADHVPARRA